MHLMIDNYDSFTFNIVQYIGELGVPLVVRRNDEIGRAELESSFIESLIISPGPCDPDKSGASMDALAVAESRGIPTLGVCLGFECIGQYFGGRIVRAPCLMHGKVSDIHHNGRGLFEDIPSPFRATRYHSLMLDRGSVPECLDVTAMTEDGLVMAVRHKALPIHGVQFHPESVLTENGKQLLNNFLMLARTHNKIKLASL